MMTRQKVQNRKKGRGRKNEGLEQENVYKTKKKENGKEKNNKGIIKTA